MGHTAWSQRVAVDILREELKSYVKALRPEEQKRFTELLGKPLLHIGSISNASSLHIWALFVISIVVEQQKQIEKLEHVLNGYIQDKERNNPVDKTQKSEHKDRATLYSTIMSR